MKDINLVIIIYSNLSIGGGGRETWLANFTNASEILKSFKSITVLNATSNVEQGTPINFPREVNHRSVDVTPFNNVKRISTFASFCSHHIKASDKLGDKQLVICLGSYIESIAGYFACRGTKAFKVTWIRGILEKELAQRHSGVILELFKKLEIFLLKRNQLVLSNGQDTADFYIKKGIPSKVINNGIYLDKFSQSQKGDKIRLGFVGRLNLEKGINYFIQCLDELQGEQDIEVIVAGDGFEKEALLEAKKRLNGKVSIQYVGVVDNHKVPELLSKLDISFHLTGTKILGGGGVSHSLIEAMASGNRIVCWDNDIFRQVEGFNNFFAAKEESQSELLRSMHDAIQDARNASGPSQLMVKAAQEYSFSSHVNRFLKIAAKHIKL
ncbi:glycosyltransferase family 4 protein [Pseudoalteromonas sp. SS15]|uniref:glycosyltransferase family 4 protein n=1 Tax=Pseudoalteromonas sp. SS15 TaxID=3139393 RepID=UPI003BAD9E6D